MLSLRLQRLKQQTLARVHDKHVDRARLVTEAYQATDGEPICIRRAKAIGRFLERAPIRIWDDELLVGDRSWVQPYQANYPDQSPGAKPTIGDALQAELDAIWAYWRSGAAVVPAQGHSRGHCVPGFHLLLELGFEGLAAQARGRLAQLDADAPADQRDYLRSLALLAESCAVLGERYAQLAEQEATKASGRRREELIEIAQVCQQVPAKPARTFREAVQSLWFGELCIEAEDSPNAQSPGRLDQVLWPYYERDLAEGRIAPDQAKELLACLWLKLWAPYDVHGVMIGGLKPDGSDACNALSEMILDVHRDVGLRRQLSLRYHSRMDDALFAKTCDCLRSGIGTPQLFNDDVLVPGLEHSYLPIEIARSYSVIGCIEMTVPGLADGRAVASYTNLSECLEWTLNDGLCPISGQCMGARTGDPRTIASYDDLWQRYRTQVRHVVDAAVQSRFKAETAETATYPMPMLSLLTEDCIASATDITAGGARYNATMFCAVGIPNVADSLAAMKKLVFDEGRVDLAELLDALANDFDGREALRQMLLTEAPKYGNDDAYVDQIAYEVAKDYCDAFVGKTDPRGGPFNPSFFSFTACVSLGKMVAATPDGRRAREPLANSLCAAQGHLRNGPTALLKSAGKLRQSQATGGTSMLLDLHPSMAHKSNGHDPIASMIKTYFDDLGGTHMEISLLDSKTLRAAQQHPERYRDITVRVAGYSAQFVGLSPELQEHVIERLQR